MTDEPRLPLKVVPPLEENYYVPETGGGKRKVFGEVTRDVRTVLSDKTSIVRDHFRDSFRRFPQVPAVAKVTIKRDAIAKSHQPNRVLSDRTCPIIGVSSLGEILISATPAGLDRLAREISRDETQVGIANISTIEDIEPYVPLIARPDDYSQPTKAKLFLHHSDQYDTALLHAFLLIANELGLKEPTEIRYGKGTRIFRIADLSTDALDNLKEFVGLQSLGDFPIFSPVWNTSTAIRALTLSDFPPPQAGETYPTIGLIDSGTAPSDPMISPWIVGRDTYVPVSEQDNSHGSFVSGLIVHGRVLNHGDVRFPSCSSYIHDIVAIGKTGSREDELLSLLEDVLPKHLDIKVWNLSLGTNVPIANDTFSDFAVALDRLQDQYGVTFVLAAGNFNRKPPRSWPPDILDGSDRICAPADSLRSIVVGSVAHLEHAASSVRANQPSPFTRKGPGPLYLPKPEISHIGGNLSIDGTCSQIGVLSVNANGQLAEDIGTSFATPLITTLRANLADRIKGGASRILSRALLVHSAAMRQGKADEQLIQYQGFGVPDDIEGLIGCDPWACTLIFELSIAPRVSFEKAIFPMPECLFIDPGTVRANILMTLVYEPELDASFGAEYCRTNIEVSLGTYDQGDDGKRHQKKQVPEDPNLRGSAYEEDRVKHGFKWSPVKVYRREMVRGVKGQQWRLDLSVHHRNGHTPPASQDAVLILTVADPLKAAPVYNQMVAQMNQLGWSATDLQVHSRLRV